METWIATFIEAGEILVALVIVAVLIIAIASITSYEAKRPKDLAEAEQAYRLSLTRLKADPANPDLREGTLTLGRTYSNLCRNKGGVTIFDEVALSNDIGAACAAASKSKTAQQIPATYSSASMPERLRRLQQLRTQDLITETEYQEKRKRILDEI